MLGFFVAMAAMTLTSPAFTHDGNIPSKFTCDAGPQNPSPALAWTDAPAGTKSFALIMHDPDAPLAGGFTHWVLFDIPASIGLPAGATKADVEKAMQGHVLGTAELIGLYQRQPK